MNPTLDFDADTLACALVLTGTATPTAAALVTALGELYPTGNGPAVPDLLAAGWLVPTIDERGLRVPPLPLAEQDARLAAYELKIEFVPDEAPNNTRYFNAPALADNRHKTGVEQPAAEGNNRHEAGMKQPAAEGNNRNKTGIESEFSERLTRGESRGIAGNTAPLFSYYRGGIVATVPYADITPAQFHAVLISPQYRAQTEALRAAPVGSPQRAELKKRLDYVTPAGTFTRRANDALAETSGLLVLDFDHVPDVGAARAALLADKLLAPDLVLVFTSPSGDGLKALVRADPTATHLDNFRAWAAYLAAHYAPLGLCADEAGKDVARACFVPYDPDAWLAPTYAA